MIKVLKFHIFILKTYNLYVAITKSATHFRHLYVAITKTHLISAILYHCTGQHQVILRHKPYYMSVTHCIVLYTQYSHVVYVYFFG